jgi:REP-associated tyrosine transposase
MRTYLRNRTVGGTYFFTVNLAERRGSRLLSEHVEALRSAFRRTCLERPFTTIAWVVLPEHLHCLWRLPAGDDDYATRWRLIKSRFSRALPRTERRSASRRAKAERGVWQRRYWEHLVRDDADLRAHVDYIHINPVKHGHAVRATDWPHSSFHRFVERGWLAEDWACELACMQAGETRRLDLQRP